MAVLAGVVLAGCTASEKSEMAGVPECTIGERLHFQTVKGRILGGLKTRVHVSNCPRTDMELAFLGAPPEEFLKLKKRSIDSTTVVGFTAQSTGYIVKDHEKKFVYIAITLNNTLEDKSITQAGAN